MIAQIHHFPKKEKILQLARRQFPLPNRGKEIHIFPDFPAQMHMKQRQAFDDVRKRLKDASARIGFAYPARLQVTLNDSEKVFSSPQEAMAFAEILS